MLKTRLRCAGRSDPGRIRGNNEDAFYIDADRGFFLVVDGIGGQAAGEKAAEIAVNRIRARLERQTGTTEERIREAIAMANNEIWEAARRNPEWNGMACVLTLAVLENGSAVVGHVGDSRLYHIRRGEIRKITHDHSPVGEREDNQEISEAEAMRHPRRNEVFRDVGSEVHAPDDPEFIELRRIAFESDAALLLCTDGLSDLVPSAEIRRAVERHTADPEGAVEELIAAANRAGGKDNVTVVVIEGEQFKVASETTAPEISQPSLFAARPAFLLYGLLLAGAAAWLSRPLWIPPAVVMAPRTLGVGAGSPYSSIAAALEAARPGDTVEVAAGEYREAVRLKSGVTLRSRVERDAILRAPALVPGASPAPAVSAERVQGARLAGFHIAADARMPLPIGVLLVDSSVSLEDNEIEGAGVGIEIRGLGASKLIANGVHDCLAEGLLISGPASPWISHNAFERNHGAGIVARAGAHPALLGNVFDKNPVDVDTPYESLRERNFLLDVKPPRASARGGRQQ
jgi:serine/threonine protein phosphatase PrpC